MKFELPLNILVAGPTKCGKSEWIKRLILEADEIFQPVPARIIYCYSVWTDGYDELEDKVEFRKDIPSNQELREWWVENRAETLLILDDLMHSIGSETSKLFCITSHHAHVSCILVVQNLFYQNRYMRECSMNTDCFCLFKNCRSALQIKTLATQMFPGKTGYFMDSYFRAVDKPHGYLIVQPGHQYPLRTNIFEDTVVYLNG